MKKLISIASGVMFFFMVSSEAKSQDCYKEGYTYWFSRDNINFSYKWFYNSQGQAYEVVLWIKNNNYSKKTISWDSLDWSANGAYQKSESGQEITIRSNDEACGALSGLYFYVPDELKGRNVSFKFKNLQIKDRN